MGTNGWTEWSKHVLKELERLDHCTTALNTECAKVRVEIAILKVKAGIWGVVGGAIPVVVGLAIIFMRGYLK